MLLTYVLASRRRVLSSPSSVTYFAESSDLKKWEEAAILPKLFLSMGALNFYSELVPWTHDLFYSLSTIFVAWLLFGISFLEEQSPNYPPHSIWMIQFVAVTELEFCGECSFRSKTGKGDCSPRLYFRHRYRSPASFPCSLNLSLWLSRVQEGGNYFSSLLFFPCKFRY